MSDELHEMQGPPNQSERTVLVVDDEPSVRRALAIFFRRAGFSVLDAAGGEDAEHLLRRRSVDVLVLDLRMPDMRGDVLYHSAAALQPHLARATVFITGDVAPKANELVAACGCPMLVKPFDLGKLLAEVTRLLSRQRVA